MKAVEITNNLRGYLKNSELSTAELFRAEGSLQIDLENNDILREIEGKSEPYEPKSEGKESEGEEEIEDEELRMKFEQGEGQMQEEDDYEDEDELDDVDIDELKEAMKNMSY